MRDTAGGGKREVKNLGIPHSRLLNYIAKNFSNVYAYKNVGFAKSRAFWR